MRLVTFMSENRSLVGIATTEGVVALNDLVADAPGDMLEVIAADPALLEGAGDRLAGGDCRIRPKSEATLLAPICAPRRNILCVGKNYYDHAKEFEGSGFDASSAGQAVPEFPIFFTKPPSAVIGPGAAIDSSLDPDGTVDYEGELTVVIGLGGRGIRRDNAYKHVFGYTIVNDVTARATQHRHKQWFLGKSCDTFCPMGPAIVTAAEVGNVSALRLETRVNGEPRQSIGVEDLIFDIPTLIETASRSMTLQPGDLLATGTPAGVGVGFQPPRYLKRGDTVSVTIERIGTLTNPVA